MLDRQARREVLTDARGLDVLYAVEWTRVVLDESQNIANHKTAVFAATCALVAQRRLCLTGTPLRNVDEDVLSQLIFLGIRPMPARRAWNLQRFKDLGLDALLLTMNYEYAGVRLPGREDLFVDVRLSEVERTAYGHVETRARDLYDEMERGLVDYGCVLEMLLRLRQFCVAPHLTTLSQNCSAALTRMGGDGIRDSALASWLIDREGSAGLNSAKTTALLSVLDGLSETRVLVFSQFSSYLNLVAEALNKQGRPYFVLDGSVKKARDRAEIVRRFNEEERPWVLLLNYRIGSEGLNLQVCSEAVFTDLCWNASGMSQAAGRIWRSGQASKVHCYYLLVENSVESRMLSIIEGKGELLSEYLAGESEHVLDRSVVGSILGVR